MVAAVAIILGTLDIVLHRDDLNIRLMGEHAGDLIDIINICAKHANACDIRQIFHHVLHRHLVPQAFELARDGRRLFEAAFDKLNRIAAITHRHILREHLQLGAHFQNSAMITHHHFLIERFLFKYAFTVRGNDIGINRNRTTQFVVSHDPTCISCVLLQTALVFLYDLL